MLEKIKKIASNVASNWDKTNSLKEEFAKQLSIDGESVEFNEAWVEYVQELSSLHLNKQGKN